MSRVLLFCAAALLLVVSACRPTLAAEEPHTAPDHGAAKQSRQGAIATAPAGGVERDARTRQFLVHADSGAVLLKSIGGTAVEKVLVPHADAALYDPELELVWLLELGALSVFDLRVRSASPVAIAQGVPSGTSRVWISRVDGTVQTEDGCEGSVVRLEWTQNPAIEFFYEKVPELHIVNADWLRTQLGRSSRMAGESSAFSGPRVRLPHQFMTCDEEDSCGATAAFGARDLQLVLVADRMGGDCWHRACLLRDPHTRLFASPPDAPRWGPPQSTKPGACGLFRFDQARTSFLLDDQVCVADRPCEKLGGQALGWLIPGDTVGAAGVVDS